MPFCISDPNNVSVFPYTVHKHHYHSGLFSSTRKYLMAKSTNYNAITNNKTSCYIFRYMSPSLLHQACCPSNKTLEMDKTRALKDNLLFESKGEDGLLEVGNKSGLVEKEGCQCFPLLPMVTLQHCGKSFHASLNFSWDPSYGHKKQSPLYFRTCITDCSGCVQEKRDNFKFKSKCHPQRVKV